MQLYVYYERLTMQLFIDQKYHSPYGSSIKRKKISRSDFVDLCLKESATGIVNFMAVATTHVDNKPFDFLHPFSKRSLYFMGLDCDNYPSALAAINYLENHGIGWARIESSKDHYWILTDYIDTAPKIIEKMKRIVGVDSNFIAICEKFNSCEFRAAPRLYKIPNFETYEIHGIEDNRVLQWIEEYHSLLNDIKEAFQNLMIREAIDNNEFFTLMAEPENRC